MKVTLTDKQLLPHVHEELAMQQHHHKAIPHFCSSAWEAYYIHKFESVQTFAARIATKNWSESPSVLKEQLHACADLCSLQERVSRNSVCAGESSLEAHSFLILFSCLTLTRTCVILTHALSTVHKYKLPSGLLLCEHSSSLHSPFM